MNNNYKLYEQNLSNRIQRLQQQEYVLHTYTNFMNESSDLSN